MKTVIIKHFNTRQQHRITFVKLLVEYNNWGLRKAKENLDAMLNNNPIICEIEDNKVDRFTSELINLNLAFERI